MGVKTEFLSFLAPILKKRLQTIRIFTRTLPLKFAEDGLGRVALHLVLAVRTGRYLWHMHGILREFGRH